MSRSESRKANVTLSFRLTPDEHEAIKAAAEMQGIGPTTLARRAAFQASALPSPAYEAKGRDPRKVDMARALGMLGRIASSANQLARVANSTGEVRDRVPIYALVDQLKEVRKDLTGQA
jgi:hypothetical protein